MWWGEVNGKNEQTIGIPKNRTFYKYNQSNNNIQID
jgi:hypothetical protein